LDRTARHGERNISQLRIEYLPLADLKPYENNARTHSADQVAQIAASMRTFGWTNPILIDEAGNIIAGHGRLAAAIHLGLAEVPVIRLEGLTDQQRRALTLADNKLAVNAGWDEKLLVAELQGLGDLQGLVGFSEDELMRLLGGHDGLTDPDEAPPVPAEPVTRPGDLWLLGPHRLVCGDATCAADVAAALGGVVPHLMVTDPPYGVNYDPVWRMRAGLTGPTNKMGLVVNDDRADWQEAWKLFPGDVAYVWSAPGPLQIVSHSSLLSAGFEVRQQIIWAKDRFALGRGHYHYQHEPCWYAVRGTGHWAGDRKQTTLWNIPARDDSGHGHGTQKPVECMKRPIENNSSVGQAVYDPFLGSGTTLIAAEMMGRVCHGIEIDPGYVDCAVTRWENFTGKKAERRPAQNADAA
jgi:DNA modification methylase